MLEKLLAGNLGLVAADSLPDGLPVIAGVQSRGDCPVYPGQRAPLLAIDVHNQIAENGHIRLQPVARRGSVIEFRDAVRLQFPGGCIAGVGGADDGGGGELRYRICLIQLAAPLQRDFSSVLYWPYESKKSNCLLLHNLLGRLCLF